MEKVEAQEVTSIGERKNEPHEDRIVLLSDGVFAIAMTLLVLDIRLPEGLPLPHAGSLSDQVSSALLELVVPKFISYAISFVVIAGYWLSHRRMIGYLKRMDGTFIRLNLLFLFCVATLPIPTAFVGPYGNVVSIVFLYTFNLAACGLVVTGMWWHALWKHKLVSTDMDAIEIRRLLFSVAIGPIVFLGSLVFLWFPAIIAPGNIYYTWLSFPIISFLLRYFFVGKKPQKVKEQEEVDDVQKDEAIVASVPDAKLDKV
jgi:uncharacterized membrane protein